MFASTQGHTAVVQLLLNASAIDVNRQDKVSAQHFAMYVLTVDSVWMDCAHACRLSKPNSCSAEADR